MALPFFRTTVRNYSTKTNKINILSQNEQIYLGMHSFGPSERTKIAEILQNTSYEERKERKKALDKIIKDIKGPKYNKKVDK